MKERVCITGAPYSYGAGCHIGVERAPYYLREHGLIEHLDGQNIDIRDGGNLQVGRLGVSPQDYAYDQSRTDNVIMSLYRRTRDIHESGKFPLTIGGDHSISTGSILATQAMFGPIGVISVDRHTDLLWYCVHENPPKVSCANFLRALTDADLSHLTEPQKPDKIATNNVAVIGVNSRHNLTRLEPPYTEMVFSAEDVAGRGIEIATREAIKRATDGTNGIYLTFDIDALNPQIAPRRELSRRFA